MVTEKLHVRRPCNKYTLISHVQAGKGTFFFFLRILSTLAKVSLGFAPVRYRAPSSRCNSTSKAWITGALHSNWGKRATMLWSSLSASDASSGLPLLPVRFSTSTLARLSMHGVMQLVSSTCANQPAKLCKSVGKAQVGSRRPRSSHIAFQQGGS